MYPLHTAFMVGLFNTFLFQFLFSSANKCLLKVGGYSAQLEQYQKAIEIYEQVATAEIHCVMLSLSQPFHLQHF